MPHPCHGPSIFLRNENDQSENKQQKYLNWPDDKSSKT